jgi:hypothetical protein
MSHYTTIRTQIKDTDVLIQALVDLGLSFVVKNQAKRGAPGDGLKEITVRKQGSTFSFKRNSHTTDFGVAGRVEALERPETRQLIQQVRQHYAYLKTVQEARKRGFALVQKEVLKGGTIKLVMRKMTSVAA